MANNRIQIKRTSTAGRTPNTTSSGNSQFIDAGELALNMADGILYTSNGSALIPVGANQTSINITNYASLPRQTANTSGFYPVSNTSGSALGNSTARWSMTALDINTSTLTAATIGVARLYTTATSSSLEANSYTTGNILLGGVNQTGYILVGQSTANQTVSIANGATASGSTKTINLGVNGAAGSQTNITIGSSLSNTAITVNANNTTFSGGVGFSGAITFDNDRAIRFKTVNTAAVSYFIQQNDDNFVFYSTNTAYGPRPVWTVYANSTTSNLQIQIPLQPLAGVVANGSLGSTGQVLTSSGGGVYWSAASGTGTVIQVDSGDGLTGGPITSTGTLTVKANTGVIVNSAGVFVDPAYIASITSNNTSFVGTVSAANVVSNAQLSGNLANYVTTTNLTNNLANYQTTAGLASNVATLTANNTSFVGTVSAANVVSNAQLSANLANYQTTAGLAANVATLTANNADYVKANSGITSNSSGVFVTQGTGTVVNATGVHVNAAYIGTLSANNTTYVNGKTEGNLNVNSATTALTANNSTNLGGVAAASYQLNSTLAANVATLTANNTSFVGTVSAANVVSNAQLSGNLANYVTTTNLTNNLANYQTTAGLASNVATLTANNADYLDGQHGAYYTNATNITTGTLPYAQIPANVINTTAAFTISGVHTHNANVILGSSGLSANASFGTAGQVLHSNGTATYWAADDQGVTSVATGNGLTGGTITTTGTVSVLANTGIVADATGVYVNATYIGTLSANNTTYVNGKTEGNLNVNSAVYSTNSINANNADYLDGQHGAYYAANSLLANYALLSGASFTGNVTANNANTLYDLNVGGNLTVAGNLTVTGNVTTIGANNLSIVDNFIYLNSNNTTQNEDIGIAGNYNDGTYAHTGFFRDASDGYWKVFDGYAPEPDANVNIDTANTTFNIAGLWASNIRLGNTTVYSTANSTVYSGTANNTSFVGTVSAANVVSNAQLSGNLAGYVTTTALTNNLANYQTTAGLSANVATLTANSANYVKANSGITSNSSGVFVTQGTGTVVNATGVHVNATYIGTLSANNATYLNGQLAAYYTNATNITTGTLPYAQIPANIINTTAAFTISGVHTYNANIVVGTTAGISANGGFGTAGHVLHSNGTSVYWAADDNSGGTVTSVATGNGLTGGPITTTGTVSVIANTGIVANATGVYVNATYIGTLSANNASFLGGTAAASYQLNSTLSANVATLTANNTTYLNGQLAAYYTNATNITTGTLPYAQIPANIANTTGAFTFSGVHTHSANVILGTSGLSANGGFGTAGQVLTTNGTATYWSTVAGGGANVAATYAWTNVHSFAANLTLNTTAALIANGSAGTAGQVLHSNGTATYWAADDQGVTSVAAGTGLSGGTITSTGTLSVNASYIATISANNASFLGTVAAASYARLDASGTFASRMTATASQSTSLLSATGSLGGVELQSANSTTAAFMCFHRPSAYASYFGIDTDNNFAVGGWSAGAALGLMKVGSFGVGTAASGTAGEIRATNNITAYYSDKRLKTDIRQIEDALDKVNKISGVTFVSNEEAAKYGYTDKKTQAGVIAQEIEAVLPEVVVPAPFDIAKADDGTEYSKSGQNYKTVQYEKLVPLLIEAIKELNAKVDILNNEIAQLKPQDKNSKS